MDISYYDKKYPNLSQSIRNKDKIEWLKNRINSLERQLENCRYNNTSLQNQLEGYEKELFEMGGNNGLV